MTLPRLFIIVATLLFSVIFIAAWMKEEEPTTSSVTEPIEIMQAKEVVPPKVEVVEKPLSPIQKVYQEQRVHKPAVQESRIKEAEPPEEDRIDLLFKKGSELPFIETIVYKSRVPWQKGRPAWLSDYAAHFSTSRHFIARSLHGKADYYKQDLMEGDTFNIYRPAVDLSFYLIVDTERKKLWLFAVDDTHKSKTLLKSYPVTLGRVAPQKTSGLLTPLGVFSLGNKVAIYKPKVMGFYAGKKVEMMRVYGTRWIPFEKEISGTTAPAKGFGIHGVPWKENSRGELVEDPSGIGKCESDGCIRLLTKDIEEIFAVIVARPASIEVTKNYFDAQFFKK